MVFFRSKEADRQVDASSGGMRQERKREWQKIGRILQRVHQGLRTTRNWGQAAAKRNHRAARWLAQNLCAADWRVKKFRAGPQVLPELCGESGTGIVANFKGKTKTWAASVNSSLVRFSIHTIIIFIKSRMFSKR